MDPLVERLGVQVTDSVSYYYFFVLQYAYYHDHEVLLLLRHLKDNHILHSIYGHTTSTSSSSSLD